MIIDCFNFNSRVIQPSSEIISQDEAPGGENSVEVDTGPPLAPVRESLPMSVAHHCTADVHHPK